MSRPKGSKGITKEEQREIIRLWAGFCPKTRIAERVGRPYIAVCNVIRMALVEGKIEERRVVIDNELLS